MPKVTELVSDGVRIQMHRFTPEADLLVAIPEKGYIVQPRQILLKQSPMWSAWFMLCRATNVHVADTVTPLVDLRTVLYWEDTDLEQPWRHSLRKSQENEREKENGRQ